MYESNGELILISNFDAMKIKFFKNHEYMHIFFKTIKTIFNNIFVYGMLTFLSE
jgi:hypothetical protein